MGCFIQRDSSAFSDGMNGRYAMADRDAPLDVSAPDMEAANSNARAASLAFAPIGVPICILIFISVFGEGTFIPEPSVKDWGDSIAVGLTVTLLAFSAIKVVQAIPKIKNLTFKTEVTVAAVILCFALAAGFFASSALVYGIPNAYTAFYGIPAVKQVTAVRWSEATHGKHSHCASVDVTVGPGAQENLCMYTQVLPGTILTLHGRKSAFGFHVEKID